MSSSSDRMMPRKQSLLHVIPYLLLFCCTLNLLLMRDGSATASGEHSQPFYSVSSLSSSSPFVFTRPDQQFRTEYGEFKAVILEEENLMQKRRFAVGMLTMQPQTLLLPHYINGPSVVYVHKGQARISQVSHSNGEVESVELTDSEIHIISGGTILYVVNAEVNENLEILLLVDLSELPKGVALQSFYLAGGTYPTSILSGFTDDLLGSAFKVAPKEVRDFLRLQHQGPIVNASDMLVEDFKEKSLAFRSDEEEASRSEEEEVNKKKKDKKKGKGGKDKHYLLLDEKHVFRNRNGWMARLDEKNAKILKRANVGILAVGLKSGSMLAPHWNPDMSIIGVVTHGRGSIQIIRSDGFIAVNKVLGPGSVFIVPRYHPSCQLAMDDSDFEFIGFAASSRRVNPQFLAGANSIFTAIDRNFLSKVFNVDKEILSDLAGAQPDAMILTMENSDW